MNRERSPLTEWLDAHALPRCPNCRSRTWTPIGLCAHEWHDTAPFAVHRGIGNCASHGIFHCPACEETP